MFSMIYENAKTAPRGASLFAESANRATLKETFLGDNGMAQTILAAARQLIEQKQYAEARAILLTIQDDPTAVRWLAKLDERFGQSQPVIPAPPSQQYPMDRREERALRRQATRELVNDELLEYVIAAFVQKDWKLISQTERSASFEKSNNNAAFAALLVMGALLVFLFLSSTYGLICLVTVAVLIGLSFLTQKRGNAQVTAMNDGSVRVVSNNKNVSNTYDAEYRGRITA